MDKTALVLEGGALRGQYTAGVLDTFLTHGLHFDTVIGVSAGALCGTNYVSEQLGRTTHVNVGYRHDPNYISLRRALHREDIINLDYLFAPHGDGWEDFDQATYDASPTQFVVVATSVTNGRPVYFVHPTGSELVDALKASSAMPFISAPQDTRLGLCLDGGITDSIPYGYAQAAGFDKIVVIRTRERAYRKAATSPVLAAAYQHTFGEHPAFVEAAIGRPEMYNRQADALDALERAGAAFVIAPSQPVTVKRLEGDTGKLQALYDTGRQEGEARFAALQDYLKA
ncbi:patatin-like phospholipase family protein [Lacticaseibacillus kribbianus]|uniref:patatin-like phospholipase family protein n=1 Tax=Lacticaseibacillus kribbianus TaxID=2926292 RepID=UPI001CD5BE91|nr:patatin family protein [Lacticaseibacillus kribbianus]